HEPPARPRHIFVVDEIPTTGVGKIFKPRLREIAVEYKLTEVLRKFDNGAQLVEIRGGNNDYHVVIEAQGLPGKLNVEQEFETAILELPIKVMLDWIRK